MAAAAFAITGTSSTSWIQSNGFIRSTTTRTIKNKKKKSLFCVVVSRSSMTDPYKTLKIHPDASESEVKTAFRRLALKYHPDVCKGSNCMIQFHQINEAYDMAMSNIRGETKVEMEEGEAYDDAGTFRGMDDPDWDMWEEWMGWEGAGIRDYSSHINPYI
ncbi:chaperone protein dnaJ 8, chloroplastic [Impatiens glandulifera]|uniref:chaperone protein dnaJ 8, chloroplastic n=1 Tax=Impatiens glandulifera TaxID=253017 RepID=UPI001FB058B7|nr:chaperone protein dnaJ 8, chloroplastic [Impatiens glandulifera]